MDGKPSYGVVERPPIRELSRRAFMRRVLSVGLGMLSLEFVGGTLAFLWPNITSGVGATIALGSAADIAGSQPEWTRGLPYLPAAAPIYFVNVPAAKARVEGRGEEVADPGTNVVALWRKCPHLGCIIPQLCEASQWFECLCHGSKYTILGEKRDGPAPRGLDSFPVTMESGVYVVDTSEVLSGAPPGTATFDTRAPTEMPHCTG